MCKFLMLVLAIFGGCVAGDFVVAKYEDNSTTVRAESQPADEDWADSPWDVLEDALKGVEP